MSLEKKTVYNMPMKIAFFAFAQANHVLKFGQHFLDAIATLSCDDLNKMHVGSLAVSRYHQLQHFFLVDKTHPYQDHDFPYPDSKIIPSGYMVLQHRERSNPKKHSQSLPSTPVSVVRKGANCRSQSLSKQNHCSGVILSAEMDKFNHEHWPVPVSGSLHVFNHFSKFFKVTSF